ncbi:MAG TPA: beta-ketoacyl synthase N-terminal-like domain-containing protein, partial [Spirochaetia bacterium]|nr:beta-ketoacyl synthase N-terminal-like domain-containing protein [Spirochaetia bacterium]
MMDMKNMKGTRDKEYTRVAVTGLGAVSSIGTGRQAFWEGLLAGSSGVSPIRSFDTTDYRVKIGGEIHGFRIEDFLPKRQSRRYGRASQIAIAAALLALEDAGLSFDRDRSESPLGLFIGSTMGECREQEIVMRAWARGSHRDLRRKNIIRLPDSLLACNVMHALRMGSIGSTFPT